MGIQNISPEQGAHLISKSDKNPKNVSEFDLLKTNFEYTDKNGDRVQDFHMKGDRYSFMMNTLNRATTALGINLKSGEIPSKKEMAQILRYLADNSDKQGLIVHVNGKSFRIPPKKEAKEERPVSGRGKAPEEVPGETYKTKKEEDHNPVVKSMIWLTENVTKPAIRTISKDTNTDYTPKKDQQVKPKGLDLADSIDWGLKRGKFKE